MLFSRKGCIANQRWNFWQEKQGIKKNHHKMGENGEGEINFNNTKNIGIWFNSKHL